MGSIPIILVLIAATAYGRIPWDSDCHIYPSRQELNADVSRVEDISDPLANAVMTANNNDECEEGNVWWNYPQGSLRVNFRSSIFHDFIICFTDGFRQTHVQYQTLVGSRDISHDNQNETCVDSADGLVEVQFDAPPMLMYMTLTDYRIIPRTATGLDITGKCTIMPKSGSMGSVMTVHNDDECDKGSVWWNYPQGSLRVNFQSRHFPNFIICFTEGFRSNHVEYETIIGRRDPAHDNRNETCVDSGKGIVEVQFEAPLMMVYMTLTDYRIIPYA